MLKIRNALKSSDRSKFQALYQSRNNWPPLADSRHLLEFSCSRKKAERDILQQWADEMETPPFSLSQFELDWSVVTKDNIGIPYAIMDITEDWTLRPDCNGLTYLMRAAQLRDSELIRVLLGKCSSPKSSSSCSSKSSSKCSSKSNVPFFLQKDKNGLHALDYAIIAGGEIDSVLEFLEWVDINDVVESSKYAKKSYYSKIDRFLKVINIVYAEDRRRYRKINHILRENINQLVDDYQWCYDMEDLVAPDKHGYTGLMLAADTNLQNYDILVEIMLNNTLKDEISAVDEDGFSALDYAIARNNTLAIRKITEALDN